MIVVLIIPTGIGAEIGGHAGDGNPVAKLLASTCDTLIVHPNVVNASDINEMTENTLYVEGSMLDRFLEGEIGLRKVLRNKILLVANKPLRNEMINAATAARATVGAEVSILELNTPLEMKATKDLDGCATGEIFGCEELVNQVEQYDFDALAIASEIKVDKQVTLDYLENGGINPWGGVEAKLSKFVSKCLDKPVAHAPICDDEWKDYNEVVDPRLSAEIISQSFLISVLKGLHRAPQVGDGYVSDITVEEVGCLVSPIGCYGPPHKACNKAGIPVIVVRENKTCLNLKLPVEPIFVDNYWEAAGYIMSMNAGIHPMSVRRPLEKTEILR